MLGAKSSAGDELREGTPSAGHGLVGMRERLSAFGGSLDRRTARRGRLSGARAVPIDGAP